MGPGSISWRKISGEVHGYVQSKTSEKGQFEGDGEAREECHLGVEDDGVSCPDLFNDLIEFFPGGLTAGVEVEDELWIEGLIGVHRRWESVLGQGSKEGRQSGELFSLGERKVGTRKLDGSVVEVRFGNRNDLIQHDNGERGGAKAIGTRMCLRHGESRVCDEQDIARKANESEESEEGRTISSYRILFGVKRMCEGGGEERGGHGSGVVERKGEGETI